MGVPVPAAPAPLSWQVLSWPVDADSEESAVTNKKAGQRLKKASAKVGCREGTTSKNCLSYSNSDGARRDLLLCQFWASGSIPSIPYLQTNLSLLWEEGSSCFTHPSGWIQRWACGWAQVTCCLIKGPQPSADTDPIPVLCRVPCPRTSRSRSSRRRRRSSHVNSAATHPFGGPWALGE